MPPTIISHVTYGESIHRFRALKRGSFNPPPPCDPFPCGLHTGAPITKIVPANNKVGNGGRPYYACTGGCFLGWGDRTGKEGADTFREQRAVKKTVREDWIDNWDSTKASEKRDKTMCLQEIAEDMRIVREEEEERLDTMLQETAEAMRFEMEEADSMLQEIAEDMRFEREEEEERLDTMLLETAEAMRFEMEEAEANMMWEY